MAYHLNPDAVEVFHVPLMGHVAAEVPPPWLVKRLQDGSLYINPLGGLSTIDAWGGRGCQAGDMAVLQHDDVHFCTEAAFSERYTHH